MNNYNMSRVNLPKKSRIIGLVTGFAHVIARIYLEDEEREAFFSWGNKFN